MTVIFSCNEYDIGHQQFDYAAAVLLWTAVNNYVFSFQYLCSFLISGVKNDM